MIPPQVGRRAPALHALALAALLAAAGCSPAAEEWQGLVVEPTPAAGPAAGPAEADDRPLYHDFGRVPDGERVEHVFRLRNTDGVPVRIDRMDPSCGCTVPSISYVGADGVRVEGDTSRPDGILTVPPGAVAELAVRIDTAHIQQKNQDKLLNVRLTTSSEHTAFLTLECHLVVHRPFRGAPQQVLIRNAPVSLGGVAETRLFPEGSSGDRITGVASVPEGYTAELLHEPQGDRETWRLRVEALPPLEVGRSTAEVLLDTVDAEGRPGPPFPVTVAVIGLPDLLLEPSRIVLRDFTDGALASGTAELVTHVPGQRFAITGHSIKGSLRGHLELEVEPIDPDSAGRSARWLVRLETLPGIDARSFSGSITLHLDAADVSEFTFTYAGLSS